MSIRCIVLVPLIPLPPFINLHNSLETPCLNIFRATGILWFINAFFIIVFVPSSNTAFTYPFAIILSVIIIDSLLLTDLNADTAAACEDLISLLTLSNAVISTVN